MSKISLPEGIIMILIAAFSDGVEALVSLTGFGIIIGEVINFAVSLVLGFWLFTKGGISSLKGFGIGSGVDFLSGSFLPGKTGGVIASIIKINSQAPDEDEVSNEFEEKPLKEAA